jgi:hypothetical protein
MGINEISLMENKIFYREGEIPLGEVKRLHKEGVIFVCGICGSELIVAFDDDESRDSNFGAGVFCPNDLKHVNVRVMGRRSKMAF